MSSKIIKTVAIFICLLYQPRSIFSQSVTEDTVKIHHLDDILDTTNNPQERLSYWKRLFQGNVDRSFEKPIDISFAIAPSYTREASFGIGGMVSGLYRLDRTDSIMDASDITLTANLSLLGFFSVKAKGNNYFKGNRTLLSYETEFRSDPLDFWGISFAATSINPMISHMRQQIKIATNLRYRLSDRFYVGGAFDFVYSTISSIDDISYLEGQNKSYTAAGLGGSVQYDTRDFIPNARKGIHIFLRQSLFPNVLNNASKTIYRTTFIFNTYKEIWRGGIFATDLYGQFNSNNSPWPLRERLGGGERMRGYYIGRYTDNSIASAQVELRQHVFQRFGFVTWVGTGTVFPTILEFRVKNLLPNYGLGLRFEFKNNMNARVDVGFGKHDGGVVFNVGEAF